MAVQVAGRRYGEGMKGYVEDCACMKSDDATFCAELRRLVADRDIKSLRLYWSPSGHLTVSGEENIKTVIDIIASRKRIVVKTFKGSDSDARDGFQNEIRGFLKVGKILKSLKYHTISPGFVKDGHDIYGIIVERSDRERTYHTFTEGCSTPVDELRFDSQIQFDKFVREIGEALEVMHTRGYHHNDIKPDNMIYCPNTDRFKLIDWELSGKFKDEPAIFYKCGTSLYNHPIKFYNGGLPVMVAKQLMAFTVARVEKHQWLKKMKSYRYITQLAHSSIDWIMMIDGDKSRRSVHHKYGPYLDNWAFAVTVIFLAEKHGLKVPEEKLRELMGPFLPQPVYAS